MLPENELERLLQEHAAARDAGLLRDGPGQRELAAVRAEMNSDKSASRSANPVVLSVRFRRVARTGAVAAAWAASLVLAVVVWERWVRPTDNKEPEKPIAENRTPSPAIDPAPAVGSSSGSAELFGGRGRVVAVGTDTKYTVVDAGAGMVRLEQGELYVEMPADESLRVEVETAAGTAVGEGTGLYAGFTGGTGSRSGTITAVAVGGSVELANVHGRVIGEAGEVLSARRDIAPTFSSKGRFPPPMPWGGRSMGPSWLLAHPAVQAELKLTDTQKSQLRGGSTDPAGDMRRFFEGMHSLSPEQRAERVAAFRVELEKRIASVLTPAQMLRLRQISLQQEGLSALGRTETADRLGLTADQRASVDAALRKHNETRSALFVEGGPRGHDDVFRKLGALRMELQQTLNAVLTADQKSQWRSALGEAFVMPRPEPGRRPWGERGSGDRRGPGHGGPQPKGGPGE